MVGIALALKDVAGRRDRDADLGGGGRHHLVGETGDRVLLVDEVGNVVLLAPAEQRNLDVGAEADGNVGGALLLEATGEVALGGPDTVERRERRPGARAVEARDLDVHERESRLRDERSLELGRTAKERDLVPSVAELLRERERWVDVAGGAAGGDCDPHASVSFARASFPAPSYAIALRWDKRDGGFCPKLWRRAGGALLAKKMRVPAGGESTPRRNRKSQPLARPSC